MCLLCKIKRRKDDNNDCVFLIHSPRLLLLFPNRLFLSGVRSKQGNNRSETRFRWREREYDEIREGGLFSASVEVAAADCCVPQRRQADNAALEVEKRERKEKKERKSQSKKSQH